MLILLFLITYQSESNDIFVENISGKEIPSQKPTFIDFDLYEDFESKSNGNIQSIL